MSILGGGGEIGFCTPSSGNVYEVTTAGTFAASYARCSINIGATADVSSYAEWAFSSATTTPNIGFMGYGARPGFGGEYEWIVFRNSTNVAQVLIRVQRVTNTGALDTYVRAYYRSGGVMVQVGATAQVTMGLQKWDISISEGVSGYIRVYVSGTLLIDSGTLDTSGLSTVSKVWVEAAYGANFISEMILADEITVRMRGITDPITAAGPDTDWSGAFGDINEIVYSDAAGITSGTANQVSTYTASSPTLTYTPLAVLVGARGALGASGPTGLETALHIGSTNYFSSNTVQAAGYGAKVGIWNTDPSTSAAWGATNAAAAKPGVKSIA